VAHGALVGRQCHADPIHRRAAAMYLVLNPKPKTQYPGYLNS